MQNGQMLAQLLAMSPEQLKAAQHEAIISSIKMETGPKLIVPENVPLDTVIQSLQRRKDEEEMMVDVAETIHTYPLDGAYNLGLLIEELFSIPGTATKHTVNTFFGAFEEAGGRIFQLETPAGTINIPWGIFELPGIEGKLYTNVVFVGETPVFRLTAHVKGKHKAKVVELANKLRDRVKEKSIYKGQAIKMVLRNEAGDELPIDPLYSPTFMDLSSNERPIFNEDIDSQIETSIYNHLRYIDKIKANGMKTRRTILLEGDYGTGKTLLGLQVARECVDNGWTFINLQHCEDLSRVLNIAKHFGRVCIFTEDVDRTMGGDRDKVMDQLSYAIDGIDSKNRELLVILTTNNVESIQKLMLRPGRIDTPITLTNPDLDTQVKLLFAYGNGRVKGDAAEFRSALKPVEGQSAAMMREVVAKAELSAVARPGDMVITPNDVNLAAKAMQNHIRIMNSGSENVEGEEVALGELMVKAPSNLIDKVIKKQPAVAATK